MIERAVWEVFCHLLNEATLVTFSRSLSSETPEALVHGVRSHRHCIRKRPPVRSSLEFKINFVKASSSRNYSFGGQILRPHAQSRSSSGSRCLATMQPSGTFRTIQEVDRHRPVHRQLVGCANSGEKFLDLRVTGLNPGLNCCPEDVSTC
ncbi:hypothetical protein MPTK1_4g20230 [Marchantia polymorpha subsp. ruderalis]